MFKLTKFCCGQLLANSKFSLTRIQSCGYSGTTINKIGFIGLGNMGSAMSKNLINKGYEVIVYDLNPEMIKKAETVGCRGTTNKSDLAQQSDCVVTMLPAGNDVLELYTGKEGILGKLKPGTLVIDSSTVDPAVPQQLEPLFKKNGLMFIDAPVTGGQIGAINATLTFIVGGDTDVMEKAKPILLSMGSRVVHCGKIGNGQVAKICNNMLLGISMTGLSEAMNLGTKLGLDPKILSFVINNGTGRCWSSEVNNPVPGVLETSPSSKDYQAGFASRMIYKDLLLAKDIASRSNASIALGHETVNMYKTICENNIGNKDFSVVYDFLKNKK